MKRKRLIYIMAMALMLLLLTACSGSTATDEGVEKQEYCLNTTCSIKILGMDEQTAQPILDGAFEEMTRYENMLSKTISGSDVDKINKAGGKPVKVSKDTINVLKIALEMGDLSDGMFDVTIGEITAMWDFTGDPKVPAEADIKKALKKVNYKAIKIDGQQVSLDTGAQLDLGGVAKGYIADKVTEYLREKGVEHAIVNLGGNVVAIGKKPGDGGSENLWTIGIERPYSDRTELIGSIEVADETVVTSGIYERKFEENGKMYHHVLSPRTGFPTDSGLEAVTIRAKAGNSGFCDALSTVCLMLGEKKSQALVKELQKKYPDMGIEASFIDSDDNVTMTDGMNAQLSK